MGEIEDIEEILGNLMYIMPEINSASVSSIEDLPIVSLLSNEIDDNLICALTSANLSIAEKTIVELKKGEFEQLYVKGTNGYVLIRQAGDHAVLCISTSTFTNLGLAFLECGRACKEIAEII